MFLRDDKVVVLNHRLGKIALHSVASKDSVLRVRVLPTGTLETLGRAPGGAWDKTTVTACSAFLAALRTFLTQRQDHSYRYLEQSNVSIVDRRFRSVKQP